MYQFVANCLKQALSPLNLRVMRVNLVTTLFLLREGGRASAVCSVDLLHTFDISIHLLDC